MAPDTAILKRQRSRPSEWWAAAPSPAPPHGAPTKSTNAGTSRQIQDAPAAGNRGKILKNAKSGSPSGPSKRISTQGEEQSSNAEDEPNTEVSTGEKTLPKKRTTRRSNGSEDGAVVTTSNGERAARKKKEAQLVVSQTVQGSTSQIADDDPSSSKRKRGPHSVSQAKGLKDSEVRKGSGNVATSLKTRAEGNKAQKGGRPSKSQGDGADESDSSTIHGGKQRLASKRAGDQKVEAEKKVRRGRSSNNEAEIQSIFNEATKYHWGARKALDSADAATKVSSTPSNQDDKPRRNRVRQSDATIEGASTAHPESNARRSTRERRSNTVLEVVTATSSFSRDRTKKKDRNEPSQIASQRTATSVAKPSTKSKKGSKSNTEPLDNIAPNAQKSNSKAVSTGERRPRKRTQVEEPKDSSHVKKRRRVEEDLQHEGEEVPEEEQPSYQHLTSVTRKVPHETIETKWSPLPAVCIELISNVLQDLQRPVLVRLNDERRKNQAKTALRMVSEKIVHKLSKGMPFPAHREDHFNFERILDKNRALEAQLTPALHSNELLEAELRNESTLLESEELALEELQSNAKIEATRRKQAERKLHPLLQSADMLSDQESLSYKMGLSDGPKTPPPILDIHSNPDLNSIFEELDDHVDSIQSNLSQVQGIAEALGKSKGAVQAVLFDHLAGDQYQDVILGENV